MSFEAPKNKDGWTQVTTPSHPSNFQAKSSSLQEEVSALHEKNPFAALSEDAEKKYQKEVEGPQPVERVDKTLQSSNPFGALEKEEEDQ